MGREEQQEEREVLDSIFPDEITDVSDVEFRVAIQLDVDMPDGGDDGDVEPPIISLHITYPEDYPEAAPNLDLAAPPSSAKHEHLDVSTDKARLLDSLQPTIEENLGMAMVFALVSALKDAAELLIAERQQAARAVHEATIARAEEEENRRFHGTMVTREKFLEWRDKFRSELEEAARKRDAEREAEEKKKRGPKEERKMTGKELWEKGLVGKVDEEEGEEEPEDEAGQDGLEEVKKLTVQA